VIRLFSIPLQCYYRPQIPKTFPYSLFSTRRYKHSTLMITHGKLFLPLSISIFRLGTTIHIRIRVHCTLRILTEFCTQYYANPHGHNQQLRTYHTTPAQTLRCRNYWHMRQFFVQSMSLCTTSRKPSNIRITMLDHLQGYRYPRCI